MEVKYPQNIELRRLGEKNSQFSVSKDETHGAGYKCCQIIEILVVMMLICLTWCLLSLPVIFYHLELNQTSTQNSSSNNVTLLSGNGNSKCLNSSLHDLSDDICYMDLLDALSESNCQHEGGATFSLFKRDRKLVNQVFQGFEFINARESCLQVATSFLCLYAYGVCSSTGVNVQPTSNNCEQLRDSLCQTEWQTALNFGIALPDCNELPSNPPVCEEFNSRIPRNSTVISESEEKPGGSSAVLLECSDGFYRENGSQICIPSCYTWTQYERKLSVTVDVLVILIAVLGSIVAIAIFIIACLKPKRMCSFPAVLVVYMLVDVIILESLAVIGFIGRSTLFCSARNLLTSLQNVTPYCVITGILFSYMLYQLALWWFIHTIMLFWKVFFPFRSQTFTASGKLKYLHIFCLVVGLLLPLTTVVATIGEFGVESTNKAENGTSSVDIFVSGGLGYSATTFPQILCTPTDEDVLFYSFILPLALLQAVGSTALILSLWRIHRRSVNKGRDSSNSLKFGTAEKKLLIVFFYFEILASILFVTFSLNTRYDREFIQSVFNFFVCEQSGHDPENPCSRADINRLSFPAVTTLSYIILGSFPFAILVYALNIKELKNLLCAKRKGKLKINKYLYKPSSSSVST